MKSSKKKLMIIIYKVKTHIIISLIMIIQNQIKINLMNIVMIQIIDLMIVPILIMNFPILIQRIRMINII